ncbi:hypothetical protein HDV57DRAFT_315781 [Trichoderma longibrachiatum]|uniref:Uncharacterized protein n=1 Tax=Trichoderma longibrachiatum ATCC 18648 TaxID=983965 RepID=A0A2T4BPB0_TRILO|nr:hypothetical protein M440DRAFT_1155594 [Trichoderma longibrachiatum ATCC 18648]
MKPRPRRQSCEIPMNRHQDYPEAKKDPAPVGYFCKRMLGIEFHRWGNEQPDRGDEVMRACGETRDVMVTRMASYGVFGSQACSWDIAGPLQPTHRTMVLLCLAPDLCDYSQRHCLTLLSSGRLVFQHVVWCLPAAARWRLNTRPQHQLHLVQLALHAATTIHHRVSDGASRRDESTTSRVT